MMFQNDKSKHVCTRSGIITQRCIFGGLVISKSSYEGGGVVDTMRGTCRDKRSILDS
jgi:hypothetical protein